MHLNHRFIKKIDHIGIAVESIDKTLPFYTNILCLPFQQIETIDHEQVRVATLSIGTVKIELLEPMSESSPIYTFLQKKGEGIHHIALKVDSLDQSLNYLKHVEIKLIDNYPTLGANQTKIAFVHPSSTYGVLLELCESKNYPLS